MLLKVALALVMMVAPAWSQTIEPETRPGQTVDQAEPKPVPWLVTILYELNVKDLIADLQAQKISVSMLEGVPESQSITNIVSGLVMSPSGQIVSRLANFGVKPKPDCLTVITSDGRRLRPKSVEYDPASGYSILEVPELTVQPPPFALSFTLAEQGQNLRLVYQVPDKLLLKSPKISSELKSQTVEAVDMSDAKKSRVMEKPGARIIAAAAEEDEVRLTPRKKEWIVSIPATLPQLDVGRLAAPDGSVVLNRQGEVIGLMELHGQAKAMIKSIEDLQRLADRLIMREPARRGWIGVRLAQLPNSETQQQLEAGPEGHTRIVVEEVIPNSPAAHADLKPDDVVRRINGREVNTLQELSQIISGTPLGTEIPIEVLRNGEIKSLNVRIEPRPRSIAGLARRSLEARADRLRESAEERRRLSRPRSTSAVGRLDRLGIRVESLTPAMKEFFGTDSRGGVLVTEVATTGPAGQAGLRAGDVIVAVNGKFVAGQRRLEELIARSARIGKTILLVRRNREAIKITLDLSKPF